MQDDLFGGAPPSPSASPSAPPRPPEDTPARPREKSPTRRTGVHPAAWGDDLRALANRLPPTLVALLILFPVASLVLIGYVSGQLVGAHFLASTELILLLTLVLLLIGDLNRPRSGTISTPQTPLLEVQAQIIAARQSLAAGLSAGSGSAQKTANP